MQWFDTVEDGLVWLSPSWKHTTFVSQLALAYHHLSVPDEIHHSQFLRTPTTYANLLTPGADAELASMCQSLKRLPQRKKSQRKRRKCDENQSVPVALQQAPACSAPGSTVGQSSDGSGSPSSED